MVVSLIANLTIMPFLLIYRADQQPFDLDDVLLVMQSIGVSDIDLDRMSGALISGHYSIVEDSVIVELKTDRQTVAISDYGPAALKFAINLQSSFSVPLLMIDENYSFELALNDYDNQGDLKTAIEATTG
jgi:hypothetical protein